MKRPIRPLREGEVTLMAGMVATVIGIVLFCVGQASAMSHDPIFLTPATGDGIIATGVLIWLKGVAEHSWEL